MGLPQRSILGIGHEGRDRIPEGRDRILWRSGWSQGRGTLEVEAEAADGVEIPGRDTLEVEAGLEVS